jgi:hypothetical protein
MFLKKIAFAVAGFAAGIVVTVTTLSGTVSPVGADQAENAYLLAQKAQVAQTTYQLDSIGLHEIDVDSQAGTITAGALGSVRRARIGVQVTEWPAALKESATGLVATMKSLEEAIRTEDPGQVAPLAKKAHDDGHDLSAAVYTWLDTGKAPEQGHGH